MTHWCRKRTAINQETNQSLTVYTGTGEFDTDLYPTLYFEYFNDVPNYNTFQLMFPMMEMEQPGQELLEE